MPGWAEICREAAAARKASSTQQARQRSRRTAQQLQLITAQHSAAQSGAAQHLVGKLGAAALDALLHVDGVAQRDDVCMGWFGYGFEVFEKLSEFPGLTDAFWCDRHPLLHH